MARSGRSPLDLELYRRPSTTDHAVEEFLRDLGLRPEAAIDLGGTMSLNIGIDQDIVVRLHPRFVSRSRVSGLRTLRRRLSDAGLLVGTPWPLGEADVVKVGEFIAEAERYVPHHQPPPTWDAYRWMYRMMGELHRHLADPTVSVPRPAVSTYGPPSSLRRWLARTREAVATCTESAGIAEWVGALNRKLDSHWIPASKLPCQLVHGDVRLGNVAHGAGDAAVYLDFGFAAVRPRVHDLAYSLSWILLRPDDSGTAADFDWASVNELLAEYECGAKVRLTPDERRALLPYVAAVPVYLAAVAGYTPEPAQTLRGEVQFLRIAEWILGHLPHISA